MGIASWWIYSSPIGWMINSNPYLLLLNLPVVRSIHINIFPYNCAQLWTVVALVIHNIVESGGPNWTAFNWSLQSLYWFTRHTYSGNCHIKWTLNCNLSDHYSVSNSSQSTHCCQVLCQWPIIEIKPVHRLALETWGRTRHTNKVEIENYNNCVSLLGQRLGR